MAIQNNFPNLAPTLLLDFANSERLDPRITFTRATSATYFDQLGVLQTAASGAARFDYNPSTLQPLGLLIEEQRTNSIRNNTMQGAVAGTPGTLPTNWSAVVGSGLSQEVVGTGTEGGITYIDIRVFGTTAGSVNYDLLFETNTQVAALTGQTWTEAIYQKLAAGSLTNISTLIFRFNEFTSGGVFISGQSSSALASPTSANLATQRISRTITLNGGATTAFLQGFLRITTGTGAVDLTLRIGLPQLELGAFATSVIPTTTTALTRNADVASMTGTNFSSWYNAAEGTMLLEYVGYMPTTLSGNRAIASISDGTYSNNIFFYKANGGANQLFDVINGGATQASLTFNYAANTGYKIAGAYLLNNVNGSVNGSIGTTDTSATIPSGVNKLEFRDPTGASGGQPTVAIKRFAYYPIRVTNAQLQALTS